MVANHPTIAIAALNLEEKDELVMRSLIDLLGHNAGVECEVVPATQADAVVIDTDGESGRYSYQQHRNNDSLPHPIAYGASPPPLTDVLFLKKPLRGKQIIDLLGELSSKLNDLTQQAQPTPIIIEEKASLLQQLSSAKEVEYLRISATELPSIIIDHINGRALLNQESDLELLSQSATKPIFQIDTLKAEDIEAYASDFKTYPLERVLWTLAIACSQGQLLRELQPTSHFALWRWPDFGQVPHTLLHSRLAAYMVSRPNTVEYIAQMTGASEEEITAFLNACHLCGWLKLEKGTQQETQKLIQNHSLSDGLSNAIRLIRTRLGL